MTARRASTGAPAASQGIRPLDVVVVTLLCALAALLMVMNITAPADDATRVDSHSWLMLPVFLAATLPVLWWRRGLVTVLLVSCAAMALHVVAFGSLVRCGAGLPLTFVLAFLAGSAAGARRQAAALSLTCALGVLVLLRDTAAGPELIPIVLLMVVGLFGLGRVAAHRSRINHSLRQHNEDLQRLREDRAALQVTDDRLQLAARLELLLEARLAQLATTAERGSTAADTDTTRLLLTTLEDDSRQTLEEMREVVGLLRGGEPALAPVPCVAQLDALLAQHLPAGSRLTVTGEPRLLPASVELTAYRIVEHLILAIPALPEQPVRVGLRFAEGSLEVEVAGPAARGAEARAAVARVRERARLHHGSLDVSTAHGRSCIVARVPVLGEV